MPQALLYNAQLLAIHDLLNTDEDGPPLGIITTKIWNLRTRLTGCIA